MICRVIVYYYKFAHDKSGFNHYIIKTKLKIAISCEP